MLEILHNYHNEVRKLVRFINIAIYSFVVKFCILCFNMCFTTRL